MNNQNNLNLYRLYAPVYDLVMRPLFGTARQRAIELLQLRAGERVLIPGAGTGLDLPYIADGVHILAGDFSPAMVSQAQTTTQRSAATWHLSDAQALPFDDAEFDAVILNLILSVVPRGETAFWEAWRVLRPGGRIVILDKFLPEGEPLSPVRRALGRAISALGTDPNRRLSDILPRETYASIGLDEPSLLHGQYRIVLLHKPIETEGGPVVPVSQAQRLLSRAAPLLRLPTSPEQTPEVLPNGAGLRCPKTGGVYAYRDGILNLLDSEMTFTATQEVLDAPVTAWLYDRFRGLLMRLIRLPDFPIEVAGIQRYLQAHPGDTILDLACGHGNFTVEWAKRVGPDGLVLGLDISDAMLRRAAHHVHRWGLDNVLLIRGDALRLPVVDQSLSKVNCSGGFHQFPDLPQALREIARVSTPDAVLTASTFAKAPNERNHGIKDWLKRRFELNFVALVWLGQELEGLGYHDYQWSLPGGWFGYVSARKASS